MCDSNVESHLELSLPAAPEVAKGAPLFQVKATDGCITHQSGSDASEYWLAGYDDRIISLPCTRDVWEDEVAALSAVLAKAKSRLNIFSPVYSLPDEILAYIFEILAPLDPVRADTRQWGWVNVAHTSRRFRVVAHGHALLWSKLSIDGLPWATFLSKSQQMPLDVRGDASTITQAQSALYAALAMQNIERIRYLDIQRINCSAPRVGPWLRVLYSVAPELLILNLDVEVDYWYEQPSPDLPDSGLIERPTVGPQFLTQDAPKLRQLCLSGIEMYWRLDAPIMLRSLLLELWADVDDMPLSFHEVLQCLSNMPLLQELVLWRVLPDATDIDSATRVCLPHLRLLFLLDREKRSLALWSSIVIPATCSIRLELEDFDEDASMICTLLKDHLSKPDGPTYKRVQIGDSEARSHNTHISVHSTATTVEDASAAPLVLERRYVSTYTIDADPMISFAIPSANIGLLRNVWGLLPVGPIRTISLNARLPPRALWLKDIVRILLRRFSQTETIEVQGLASGHSSQREELAQAACTCFLDELAPTAQQITEFGAESYMSRLHTLSLDNINLSLRSDARYPEGYRLYDVLAEAFECRLAVGMPLHTVNIRGACLQESWCESWRPFVGEIYWNGYRVETSDYMSSSDDEEVSGGGSESQEED